MEQYQLILEQFRNDLPAVTTPPEKAPRIRQQALDMDPPKRPNVVLKMPDKKRAARFRDLADGLTAKIEAGRADRMTNTPKRLCQAMSAKREADKLERTQQALNALAQHNDAGTVPRALAKVNSKKAVYDLMGSKCEQVPNGYHAYQRDLNEPAQDSDEARAAWQLIQGKSPEQEHAEELDRRISDLQFSKIPGYFRTPAPLVQRMIDEAQIEPIHTILEPSAGDGAIVGELERLGYDNLIVAYEINHSLCEILKLRGYDARPVDFLEQFNSIKYDRILMNPPFEKMADITHVCLAYSFLKIGGRLIAIMSPGPFSRDDKKAREFRNWFECVGGSVEDLPAGTFKESGTGVASVLIVIDKELDA